jgi:acyl-CoA thioesterase-2
MIAAVDLLELMRLEQHGPDTYVGVGPSYPWGGLYGGQIVAQALRAAAATAPADSMPHSCHAYFIRPGDADEPIRFEVQRLRDGRTYSTREVVARQSTGAILGLSASFARADGAEIDVQLASAPDVAPPDGLDATSWSDVFERRNGPFGPGTATAWFRFPGDAPADPLLGACGLAYASDDLPSEAVVTLHPDSGGPTGDGQPYEHFTGTSLDHAIWFHRPVLPDAWQLHAVNCVGLLGSRGLAVGAVFDQAGRQVASFTQEVLVRPRR